MAGVPASVRSCAASSPDCPTTDVESYGAPSACSSCAVTGASEPTTWAPSWAVIAACTVEFWNSVPRTVYTLVGPGAALSCAKRALETVNTGSKSAG